MTKLIHLGCDGLNVNKSFKAQLNDSIVEFGGKPMLEIGSCNMHIVHNGFHAGVSSVDQCWSVEDFLNDVYQFCRKYPSWSEDFATVQSALNMEKKAFKRFVNNRWLSVGPVCCRILENLSCLVKFFLKSEHSKSIKQSNMFTRICARLQEGSIMMARQHFIVSVAGVFEPFLVIFQSVSPMIHKLQEELAHVLRLLLKRFLKSDALNGKSDAQLLDVSLENRPTEQCDFGAKTQELIRQMKRETTIRNWLCCRKICYTL